MNKRSVRTRTERTPEEVARLRALRERYQRERPTPEQLLAEGGHDHFIPLGELLLLHQVVFSLKKERERQGMSLAELERRTGIDQATLSKLENGKNANPTLGTLQRVAAALGKQIQCRLCDAPPPGADPVPT
jgi:DNA-binding Xre family transcriptional regulator